MRVNIKKTNFKTGSTVITCLIACLLLNEHIDAQQLNPFGASFFQNQYLLNPAMSGLADELKLNAGYRHEWSSISNAPNNQYLTGDYKFRDKVGLGLKITNDNAGALRTTTAMAAFSYHVPVMGEHKSMHFGISAGAVNRAIDQSKLNGDVDDPLVLNYNEKNTRFDADFGVAYTDERITVQAAFPNLVSYFNKEEEDAVDKIFLLASLSYKFIFNEGDDNINIEPKLGFRGIKGYDHIFDIGSNFSLKNNIVNAFAMYHTTKNITLGAGLDIKQRFRILASYTSGTSALQGYSDGNFEIGFSTSLLKKNK